MDTRITLWTKGGNLTFLPDDVNSGPVLVPGLGVLVAKAGGNKTARLAAELAAKNLQTIPEMTREHPEAASWEEVIRNVKLPHCPPGTVITPLSPFEEPPATAMQVAAFGRAMDRRLATSVVAVEDRQGRLAGSGVRSRPADPRDRSLGEPRDRDSAPGILAPGGPGGKPDGDFVDGDGGFEYATSMKYDIGWSHDGTHPQTGRILFTMAEHYLLTGDKEWFQKNRVRMQAAADSILRQRAEYLRESPTARNSRWRGFNRRKSSATSPWASVGGDGTSSTMPFRSRACADSPTRSRSLIPRPRRLSRPGRCLCQGPASRRGAGDGDRPGTAGPQRNLQGTSFPPRPTRGDRWFARSTAPTVWWTLKWAPCRWPTPLAYSMPPIRDIGEHLDVIEEGLKINQRRKGTGQQAPGATKEHFWTGFAGLVKYSFVDKIHLRRDDVPCFLRYWMNNYAAWVTAAGGFNEGNSLGHYMGNPDDKPESGDLASTGWFVESFRNLLVIEDGQSLWLRATPRAWLEQGKKISVKNAPTHFGTLAYEIVSDADNGKISATIEMPSRKPAKEVVLRFRHPKSADQGRHRQRQAIDRVQQGQGNDHPEGPDRHGRRDGSVLTRKATQTDIAARDTDQKQGGA